MGKIAINTTAGVVKNASELDAFFSAVNSQYKDGLKDGWGNNEGKRVFTSASGRDFPAWGISPIGNQIEINGSSQTFSVNTVSNGVDEYGYDRLRYVGVVVKAGADVVLSTDAVLLDSVQLVVPGLSGAQVMTSMYTDYFYSDPEKLGWAPGMSRFVEGTSETPGAGLGNMSGVRARFNGLVNVEGFSDKKDYVRLKNDSAVDKYYVLGFKDRAVGKADYYNNYVEGGAVNITAHNLQDLKNAGVSEEKWVLEAAELAQVAPVSVDKHVINLNDRLLAESQVMNNQDVYTLTLTRVATDVMFRVDGTLGDDGVYHSVDYEIARVDAATGDVLEVLRNANGSVNKLKGIGDAMRLEGQAKVFSALIFQDHAWAENLAAGTYTVKVLPKVIDGIPSTGKARVQAIEFPKLPETKTISQTEQAIAELRKMNSSVAHLGVGADQSLVVQGNLKSFEKHSYDISVSTDGRYRLLLDMEYGVVGTLQIIDKDGNPMTISQQGTIAKGYGAAENGHDTVAVLDLLAGNYKVVISEPRDRASEYHGEFNQVIYGDDFQTQGQSIRNQGKRLSWDRSGAYKLSVTALDGGDISSVSDNDLFVRQAVETGTSFLGGFSFSNVAHKTNVYQFTLSNDQVINWQASIEGVAFRFYQQAPNGDWFLVDTQVAAYKNQYKQGLRNESGFSLFEAATYRVEAYLVDKDANADQLFEVRAGLLDANRLYHAQTSLDGVMSLGDKVSQKIVSNIAIKTDLRQNPATPEIVYKHWEDVGGDLGTMKTFTEFTKTAAGFWKDNAGDSYGSQMAQTHYQLHITVDDLDEGKDYATVFVKFSESQDGVLTGAKMAYRSVDQIGLVRYESLDGSDGSRKIDNAKGTLLELKLGVWDFGLVLPVHGSSIGYLNSENTAPIDLPSVYTNGKPLDFEFFAVRASDLDSATNDLPEGYQFNDRSVIELTGAQSLAQESWSKTVEGEFVAGFSDSLEFTLDKAQSLNFALTGKDAAGLLNSSIDVSLRITDVLGNLVGNYATDDNDNATLSANLASGTYLIKVNQADASSENTLYQLIVNGSAVLPA